MQPLLEFSRQQLSSWLQKHGEPAYREKQIRRWVFERRASDFESMSDLPKKLRSLLAEHFTLWQTEIAVHSRAIDGTEKLLLQWPNGAKIECVLIREGERRTICISSQVGCAMGCVFCASGLDGVDRNLSTAEIVEQMLRLQRLLPAEERLSHIVVMGMGEPLANLDNVLGALREANAKDGLDISARRITISTVGLPPALRRLAREEPRYHLAVSLHAPNDALRDEIVPVNRKIGIEAVLDAADEYFEASGRRLTFEYVLLGDLNDQPEHARQLAQLLRGRTALLNVIPYNKVEGLPYQTPTPESIERFRTELDSRGINIQFRLRKGDDINAACGQLRRSTQAVVSITPPPATV